MNRVILLLNLSVLVVTFFVSLGATETQVRVLRSAARATLGRPTLERPAVPPPPAPVARLVKFLARLDAPLTPRQVDALYRAVAECAAELTRGAGRLRPRAVVDRAQKRVTATLRAADVPEGELLSRLVRVVMASAG